LLFDFQKNCWMSPSEQFEKCIRSSCSITLCQENILSIILQFAIQFTTDWARVRLVSKKWGNCLLEIIKFLYIKAKNFTDDQCIGISSLKGIDGLSLTGSSLLTCIGLKSLFSLTSLKSLRLNLSKCKLVTMVDLQPLSACTNLQYLYISHNLNPYQLNTVVDGLSGLSGLRHLQSLTIIECNLPDAGMILISKMNELKSLNLSSCSTMTNAKIGYLSTMTGLTSLNLSCICQMTDVTIQSLSALTGLHSLNIHFCPLISDVSIKYISLLSELKSLDISLCFKITDIGLGHISCLTGLESLQLCDWSKITRIGVKSLEMKRPQLQVTIKKINYL
jgi:F-box/leucine-rich repeat protein 14